jgi:hypothetical protein
MRQTIGFPTHLNALLQKFTYWFSYAYTVKKFRDFPVPSRDVTNQTLSGGKIGNFFYSICVGILAVRRTIFRVLGQEDGLPKTNVIMVAKVFCLPQLRAFLPN